jgi:hypothetical protein
MNERCSVPRRTSTGNAGILLHLCDGLGRVVWGVYGIYVHICVCEEREDVVEGVFRFDSRNYIFLDSLHSGFSKVNI